jgi:hypothetical protein
MSLKPQWLNLVASCRPVRHFAPQLLQIALHGLVVGLFRNASANHR